MRQKFLLLCVLFNVAIPWKLSPLESSTAKTTIRLWHELHAAKYTPHDFLSMLTPETHASYIGIIHLDEIRAIAACDSPSIDHICVVGVAYHPDQLHAVAILVKMMCECNIKTEWKAIKLQQRVFFEMLFLLEMNSNRTCLNSTSHAAEDKS